MSLDIALPPAISASGGPPGAGPPTVADLGQAFAALLAQQGLPSPSRPIAKSPATADETREDISRKTKSDNKAKSGKNADQDGDEDPASADPSFISQATLLLETIVPATTVVPPGPLASLAAPTTATSIDSTSEAMDTRPASTPASQGSTDLISGGELLPQFAQLQPSTADPVPASALPNVLAPPASAALVSEQDRKSDGFTTASSFNQGIVPAGQDASAATLEWVSQTSLGAAKGGPMLPVQISASPKTLPSNETTVAEATFTNSIDVAAPSRTPSATNLPAKEVHQAARPVTLTEQASSQTAPVLNKLTDTDNVVPVNTSSLVKAQMDTPASAATLPAAAPDPALTQSTKTALQSYAQFAQNALQNSAKPANNTSMRGNAPVTQENGVLEKSVSAAGDDQTMMPITPVPTHAAETLREATRQGESQDDTEKDKSEVSSSQASEMLTPMNSQLMETKTATVSATAPLLAEGRAALTEQAAASLQTMHAQAAKSGHGQMTLQLHPQDWGKLQVSVLMAPSPSGTMVTAHLVADSAAVKHALEASGADLKRTLRDAGLHLDNFTVTVRPAAAGSEAQTTGGNGKQSASHDTWGSTPGNRGESAASTAAGNGGTAFGGNGASAQGQASRQRPTALSLITVTTDEPEEQGTRAATSMARRLDTRA